MKKKLTMTLLIFAAVLFSGCNTMTPAVTLKEQFIQSKDLDILRGAIAQGMKTEGWELYQPQNKLEEQILYLSKTIKKRRAYTPKPAVKKKTIDTKIYATIKYSNKHFEIDITDQNGRTIDNHHVSKHINHKVKKLSDAIYLALAYQLL